MVVLVAVVGLSFFFIVAPADEKHTVCKTLTVVGEQQLSQFPLFFPLLHPLKYEINISNSPLNGGKQLHLEIHFDDMGIGTCLSNRFRIFVHSAKHTHCIKA